MWEGSGRGRRDGRAHRHRGRGRRGLVLLSVWLTAIPASLLSFVVIGGMTARVAQAQSPGVTEYPITSGDVRPQGLVTGPDGNLWFSETTGPNIGKITPSGTITEYPVPSNASFVQTPWITNGPDGNLWFSDWGNNAIGKITTSGTITEYPITTSNAGPYVIVTGPDNNLWFYESNVDKIGRITVGGTVAEFAISSGSGGQVIAAGPDGNLWFPETSLNKIGRITTDGTGFTEFSTAPGSQPYGIIAGPDGNLWFTEGGTNNIGVMSTGGSVTHEYPIPTAGANPQHITVGPDHNLWFAEFSSNALGRITTSGTVSEYPTGTSSNPIGITAGPDNNIWYTGYNAPSIGTFSLNACANLADSASPSLLGPGAPETVNVTLTSCGVATLNATTTTTTAVPPGCPAVPAIPAFMSSLAYARTDAHVTTFGAPSCPGTYTVTSQTKVGATVMATAQTAYTVLAVGDGVLFNTDTRPSFITAGSDGNLWYTDYSNTLYRVTPLGLVTSFSNSLPPASAQRITSGPDGGLYVSSFGGSTVNGIAKVTLGISGAPSFAWQVPAGGSGNDISDIEPGVDGNVWFTAGANGSGIVGFVTPNAKFKQFKLPAGSGTPISITAGSDNAMWFLLDPGHVGRITPGGAVTLFPVPGNLSLGCNQGCAALGPDGNIWFSGSDPNTSQGYLVSISTSGVAREFPIAASVDGITAAADGNVWFNEPQSLVCPHRGGVGRVTPSGVVTEFGAGCNDLNDQYNVVPGPDGNIWNAAYYGIGINLIAVGGSATCTSLSAKAIPPTVAHGTAETVAATIVNCSTTPKLMKLVSKTTPPSVCGSSIAATTRVPVWAHVQTMVSNVVTAPACKGTYTVKLTLSSGGSVIASKTLTYRVT